MKTIKYIKCWNILLTASYHVTYNDTFWWLGCIPRFVQNVKVIYYISIGLWLNFILVSLDINSIFIFFFFLWHQIISNFWFSELQSFEFFEMLFKSFEINLICFLIFIYKLIILNVYRFTKIGLNFFHKTLTKK